MHNLGFALEGGAHVLLVGLLLGAGLPMIFALGVRAAAYASPEGGLARAGRVYPIGKLVGALCFAVVVVGVALGLTFIVSSGFGMKLNFDNVYPTLVEKH